MTFGGSSGIPQAVTKQEVITGMSPERTQEYGNIILNDYKHFCSGNKGPDTHSSLLKRTMEGDILGYLQGRLSKKEIQHLDTLFSPQHRKTFETTVTIAKKNFENRGGYNPQRGNGDNYTEINDPRHPTKLGTKMNLKDGREMTVTYKEYFTFTPTTQDPDQILTEANQFYTAIFLAYQRVQKLGSQIGSGVAVKFKDNLNGLLNDHDSAVFYVDNPQAGKLLRQIVNRELKSVRLNTDRRGRTESGFDIEFPNGDYFSHRQLIAKAVTAVIDQDYRGKRVILNHDPKWVGKSIEERANQAGKGTPEEMIQAIA